jgi:hypothetical protein
VRDPAADFGRALARFPRPNPFGVAWRWRYEAAAVAAAGVLDARVGALWTVLTGLALAATAALPFGRRRVWCVVTPHRVRTGLKHGWVHSRTGRLPMVLWTRPVPAGEELLLLLRPGISPGDMAAAAGLLATACWARAVQVESDPARPQLVRLTVVRYDAPA